MAEPYLGQIELFAFDFPPRGWASCAGQILSIGQNQALFALLGTTFGGNGVSTFALPDLRGAAAMGQGSGPGLTPRTMGEVVGSETVTLLGVQNAPHTHGVAAVQGQDTTTNVFTPDTTVLLAQTTGTDSGGGPLTFNIYSPDTALNQTLSSTAISSTGGQAHDNRMPYLAGNFCIALVGAFPSQN